MFLANGNPLGNWLVRMGEKLVESSKGKSDAAKKTNNLYQKMHGRRIRYPEVEQKQEEDQK